MTLPRSTTPPRHTLAVPVRFGGRGYLARAEGFEAALAAADVILSTEPGEVEMQPEFGSPLARLAWEPNDAALAQEMRAATDGSLSRWEPRLLVDRTTIEQDARSTTATVSLRMRGGDLRRALPITFVR